MSDSKISVRDMCLVGMFTAIIAVMAQLSIPLPGGVPISLQTFSIALAGIMLGAKNGTFAAISYILLGAIGAPVFANFAGGLHHVFGPTGGFILSFPIIAFFAGIGFDTKKRPIALKVIYLATGLALNYLCGMLFFSFVTSQSLYTAFNVAVLPFLPIEIIRIAALCFLGQRIRSWGAALRPGH